MKPCLVAAIFAVSAMEAAAQVAGPGFEVATIKPSTPFLQAIADGSLIGMKIDQGRVSMGHMDLAKLIQMAYGIKKYQLVGPDWLVTPPDPDLAAGLFDVEAKLPAGATADQVPAMLQALLIDRFKLAIRRGQRDYDTYALVVGKDGLKIAKKEVTGEPSPLNVTATEGPRGQATAVTGAYRMTIVPGRGMRIETSTIGGLLDYVSTRMAVPVIDKTALTGAFDIQMEILPVGIDSILAGDTGRATVKDAVEKLGLKLESQKNQIETIVVEHIERTPTEN